jgi:GntR family transcriptional repressor for pyruvate dehydrogenase complex
MVTPLKPRKTAMILAQRIVDEIVDDRLEPGAQLLSEGDMLKKYGVARGTLRETLRFLEMHGLITIKTGPGGGAIVADPGSQPLASVIALLLQLNRTAFRSIVEARLILEPMLARLAATRRGDDDLAVMSETIAAMRGNIGKPRLFLAQNQVFHATIAHAAGNPILFHTVASLGWIEDGTALGIDYTSETHEPIIAAHQRIVAAIRARDGEMAEAAMRLHVGEFARYAEKNYEKVLDSPLRWEQFVGSGGR